MKRDLRKYSETTTFRVIIGGVLIIFIVGLVLIGLIYGVNSALFGLFCLLSALIPAGLIILTIYLVNRYVENEKRKQE